MSLTKFCSVSARLFSRQRCECEMWFSPLFLDHWTRDGNQMEGNNPVQVVQAPVHTVHFRHHLKLQTFGSFLLRIFNDQQKLFWRWSQPRSRPTVVLQHRRATPPSVPLNGICEIQPLSHNLHLNWNNFNMPVHLDRLLDTNTDCTGGWFFNVCTKKQRVCRKEEENRFIHRLLLFSVFRLFVGAWHRLKSPIMCRFMLMVM